MVVLIILFVIKQKCIYNKSYILSIIYTYYKIKILNNKNEKCGHFIKGVINTKKYTIFYKLRQILQEKCCIIIYNAMNKFICDRQLYINF